MYRGAWYYTWAYGEVERCMALYMDVWRYVRVYGDA